MRFTTMKMTRLLIIAVAVGFLNGRALSAQSGTLLWQTLPKVPALPSPDVSGLADVNGAKLYYAIFNKAGKRPAILIHGALGSSDDWGFEVPRLAKHHEVIVIDCRGRGRSTMGPQPLTYELMASDLVGVMDLLEIRKASIVGASDGGIIGLYMAIQHPHRIDKLLAWGANYSVSSYKPMPADPEMRDAAARYFAQAKATYARLSPSPDGFAQLLAAIQKMTAREPEIAPAELAAIRTPTVIADGEHEQFISRKETRTLAALIPGARLVIIPGVSHGGPIQDPDAFHRIVIDLLDAER